MKIKTFTIVLLMAPVIVIAEPVYLNCTVKSDTESKHFQVKLDEASGKITHTGEKGGAFNTEGFLPQIQ